MSNEEILRQIDSELEKWTNRKVWVQKCGLEEQVESLKWEVESLTKRCALLEKSESAGVNLSLTLYELERNHVLEMVKAFNGNKSAAADALGITIKTLYNKLWEYGDFNGEARG